MRIKVATTEIHTPSNPTDVWVELEGRDQLTLALKNKQTGEFLTIHVLVVGSTLIIEDDQEWKALHISPAGTEFVEGELV